MPMNPEEPKRVGCCSWCNAEVFEVKTRYPEGPLYRFPRQLGPATIKAYRFTYVLGDGTQASLTSCLDCIPHMSEPENFHPIWTRVLNTFLFEERDDVRAALPSAPLTAEQKRINEEFILKQTSNHIVGVLGVKHWGDEEQRI